MEVEGYGRENVSRRRSRTESGQTSAGQRQSGQQGSGQRPTSQPDSGQRPIRQRPVAQPESGQPERRRYRPETGPDRQGQMPPAQARARAMARRRKRQRQRRLILGSLFLIILLIAGGIGFSVVHYRNVKERQAFAAAGIEAVEQGDYEAAIQSFDQALLKSKGKIGAFEKDVLLYRAEAEYKQGDYPAARNTYELLMKEDEDNAEYKKGAVLCMVETGDYGAAMELETLQGTVYNRMARDQIEAGQYDRALEYIELGKTFAEESAGRELAFNEAVVWEYKHDYVKALQLFEAYVQKYGADEAAEREITFLKTRQGSH